MQFIERSDIQGYVNSLNFNFFLVSCEEPKHFMEMTSRNPTILNLKVYYNPTVPGRFYHITVFLPIF